MEISSSLMEIAGFATRLIRQIMHIDRKRRLGFAPLQGQTAIRLLDESPENAGEPKDPRLPGPGPRGLDQIRSDCRDPEKSRGILEDR